MGLDMYLEKKNYVQNWDHNPKEEQHEIVVKQGGKVRVDIDPSKITYIVEGVGYWRKANAIHAWFVENVQNGIDNCQSSYVSTEQLKELLGAVEVVLVHKDKASGILPTQGGFFFGGQEYDEYYFQDMEETKKIITELIKNDNGRAEYYYTASW